MPKSIPKSGPQVGGGGSGGRKRKLESDEVSSSRAHPRPRNLAPAEPARMMIPAGRPGIPVARGRLNPRPATPPSNSGSPVVSSSTSPGPSPVEAGTGGRASNFLLEALRRIGELQDELDFLQNDPYAEDTDDDDEDEEDEREQPAEEPETIGGRQAEAIGWAVCARETMHFLQREGIPSDSPLMVNLRRRLIGHGRQDDGGLSC